MVQTVFVLTQQLAILNGEETITPRLIHEAVRTNLRIIEDLLAETRMRRPREMRPIGDLVDLDSVYESEDQLEDFRSSSGNHVPEKEGTSPSSVAEHREQVIGPSDDAGNKRNGHKNITSRDRKSGPKRKTNSTNDLPVPINTRKETTQTTPCRNINKFRRSPAEYLGAKIKVHSS